MTRAIRPPASVPQRLDDAFEVATLVRRFYARVRRDDLLGPVFDDVAQVDWSEHLPKLTAFWCKILFGTPGFSGAPMQAHARVHMRAPFTHDHFRRWVALFCETVDAGWEGERARYVKEVAASVAQAHSLRLTGEVVRLGGASPKVALLDSRARQELAGRR